MLIFFAMFLLLSNKITNLCFVIDYASCIASKINLYKTRETNKEIIKQRKKEYYEKNKDIINEKLKLKYIEKKLNNSQNNVEVLS